MKLLTKELEKQFQETGCQEKVKDPVVVAKYFNPYGSGTWYATEYNPASKLFFGYVTGLGHDEWGYFSLKEMESIKVPPFNLPLERDMYFEAQTISKILPEITRQNSRLKEENDIER